MSANARILPMEIPATSPVRGSAKIRLVESDSPDKPILQPEYRRCAGEQIDRDDDETIPCATLTHFPPTSSASTTNRAALKQAPAEVHRAQAEKAMVAEAYRNGN